MKPRVPIIGDDVLEVAERCPVLKERLTEDGRLAAGLRIHLYQMLGHAPGLLNAWSTLGREVRTRTQIPGDIREMVILLCALNGGAEYEYSHHYHIAVREGAPEEKLAALGDWRTSAQFSDRERAILAFADEVYANSKASDETFAAVAAFSTPRELVELTVLTAFYACVSRILLTLQIPLEDSYREDASWQEAWRIGREQNPRAH